MEKKSYHSICAWTFNAGKGGFTPANSRPAWAADRLSTTDKIKLIHQTIRPRLPDHIVLGFEAHYNNEYNEENAAEIGQALVDCGIYLAMVTPGAHGHFAYGGLCSPDPKERGEAKAFARRTVEIAYKQMKKSWHPQVPPALVLWNGSFGYDLATTGLRDMYSHLKQGVLELCRVEQDLGGALYMVIEPKPNEGHPAMLLPTVASAIVLWRTLERESGLNLDKKGINKEFGHSEMIGLDHLYDTVEEIDNHMLLHMHINSQGYNDGIILGGPGKYDIDHGARINGMNIALAGLIQQAGYTRWKGHDLQVRPYDSAEQGIDRIVRSILSWEACEQAAEEIDYPRLNEFLEKRETARAEDLMRQAVVRAHHFFDTLYRQ